MKEEKTYLQLDYAVTTELNKLSNALTKMAYVKNLEFRFAVLKEAYETGMFDKDRYETELSKIWADQFR